MSKKYNISNIFSFIQSLPLYINSLDKFNIIHYGGAIVPRIKINPNDSKNIENFIYSQIEDIDYNISKKNKEKTKKNFNKNENLIEKKINFKDKIHLNFNKNNNFNILLNSQKKDINEKNNNFINENQENIKFFFNERKELIPPKNIIKIINNIENKKNINFYSNYYYKYINNIILNNIDLIYYNNSGLHNNNKISFPKVINQINNQTIFNVNIYSNNFFPNNDTLDGVHLTQNKGKPIFALCSKSESEIDEQNIMNKKRGRKTKNLNKCNKIHKASDDDNLLRKIQVHFLSFIINFTNDMLKTLVNDNNLLFKNLDYQIKKKVNKKFIEDLKSKNISYILQLKISPKIKMHYEHENKKIYYKICNMYPFMTSFFEKSYLSLFKEYYYNKNKMFILNGQIIRLSNKTKTFNDLIIKDYKNKAKLQNLAIKKFLCD